MSEFPQSFQCHFGDPHWYLWRQLRVDGEFSWQNFLMSSNSEKSNTNLLYPGLYGTSSVLGIFKVPREGSFLNVLFSPVIWKIQKKCNVCAVCSLMFVVKLHISLCWKNRRLSGYWRYWQIWIYHDLEIRVECTEHSWQYHNYMNDSPIHQTQDSLVARKRNIDAFIAPSMIFITCFLAYPTFLFLSRDTKLL